MFRCLVRLAVFGSLAFSVMFGSAAQDDVSAEAHKTAVQMFVESVLNDGHIDVMNDLFAEDYVHHGIVQAMDQETYAAYIEAVRDALPDFDAQIEILIAEDEWAASRIVFSGTFENVWVEGDTTIPPNNQPLLWALHTIHRFDEAGRIVEDFTAFDRLDLLRQMDASPLPALLRNALRSPEHTPVEMREPEFTADLDAQKDAFRRVIEDALNNGDLTAIDRYMADDYRTHEPFGNFTREGFKDVVAGFRQVVPDLDVSIETLISEGDWLAARLIYTGTVSGEIPGLRRSLQPRERPIQFVINVFVRFNADGIGIEDYKAYNRLGWLDQVGLLEM